MSIKIVALPTSSVLDLISGNPDANGQKPEVSVSNGNGNPCRHCLREISPGRKMLVLAYRPFGDIQPYAEVGPIFLCADGCERYLETSVEPELYRNREMLIRGYDDKDCIVYGTGKVVPVSEMENEASLILAMKTVKYLHARSPTNNCYHFRIEAE